MKDFQSFILNLSKLISYKSVFDTPTATAPFGEEVNGALTFFYNLAKDMGFDTKFHQGYLVEVCYGEGEEIGIIGHLDVVPVGIGWDTPPFTLTEKDGAYYGRGVHDNKAPTLLCLYALKELKDSGIKVNRKFRLFAGGNEESGWQDVEYFKTHNKFPDYGFSPDGNFPLTYAEKGIAEIEFIIDSPKNFNNISGGIALNSVCDYASCETCLTINDKLIKKYNLSVKDKKIESFGKAAHGSTPHLGINAIKPLLLYMAECGESHLNNVIDCLFDDKYNLSKKITEQGNVTLSPNLIRQENGKLYITCDCRIPYPETEQTVSSVLDKFGLNYTVKTRHPPMCTEKDGFLVRSLIEAYNSVTGENALPIAMGGSTFARAFKYGCSFGPDNKDSGCGNLHEANEFITKEYLLKCYEIYKKAIFNLAK